MRKCVHISVEINTDIQETPRHIGSSARQDDASKGIGTLNEKPLHESLKQWYAHPGDVFEVPVDGSIVDIVRGDLLIEIQTRNFGAIRRKLEKLVVRHPVRLVYPIASEKWIVKVDGDEGLPISRRRSPKHGAFEHVFEELVRFPKLLSSPSFSLELLLVQEEEVRRYDGVAGWRKGGWVTYERRLLGVVDRRTLATAGDLIDFLPCDLAEPFTATDLSVMSAIPKRLAQRMVYCLRLVGCITPIGKRGNSVLYTRVKW